MIDSLDSLGRSSGITAAAVLNVVGKFTEADLNRYRTLDANAATADAEGAA